MISSEVTISFLKGELEQNGIAPWVNDLMQQPSLLAELDYALRPLIHEGKIQPYGFIMVNYGCALAQHRPLNRPLLDLAEARQLADGRHSFVIFVGGQYKGVLPLEESADDELKLVQLQQKLGGIICTTDTDGVTKLFCEDGVLIHQYRRWQKKPCVKCTVRAICRSIPQLDFELLQTILEFCFHELSPRKIGATLVWCLTDTNLLEAIVPTSQVSQIRQEVEVKIGPAINNAILRHVLTYSDGAVILNRDGVILGVGAHLKYSQESTRLIPTYRGTRHTSAKRFSYDVPETIIFVVSSDGPVTVYSDGVNIVNLEVEAADQPPAGGAAIAGDQAIVLPLAQEDCIDCPNCNKRLKLQPAQATQPRLRRLLCPVCEHPLTLHSEAITHADVTISVIKTLLKPLSLAESADINLPLSS